jgi:hypothetical protein
MRNNGALSPFYNQDPGVSRSVSRKRGRPGIVGSSAGVAMGMGGTAIGTAIKTQT